MQLTEDKLPTPPDDEDRPLGNPGCLGSFECELFRKLHELGAELLRLHAQEVQRAHETAPPEPAVICAQRSHNSAYGRTFSKTDSNVSFIHDLSAALPDGALDSALPNETTASTKFQRRESTPSMLRRKELSDTFTMHERWQSKLDWTRRYEWQGPQNEFGRTSSLTSSVYQSVNKFTTSASPGFDAAWGLLRVVMLWIDLICVPLEVSFKFVHAMPYMVFLLVGRCFWSLDALLDLLRALRRFSRDRRKGWENWVALRRAWGSLLVLLAPLALEWSMLILEIDGWELWVSAGRAVRLSHLACAEAKDAIRTLESWLRAALPALAADMLHDPHGCFYTAVGAHWASCFWLRGMGDVTDWHFATRGLDIVDKLLSVLAVFLITYVAIAQTTLHFIALERSSARRLRDMIIAFSRREGVTRMTTVRMEQLRQASTRGAVTGRFREEEEMMKQFPNELRRDLLGEIRQPVLTAMQLFADMNRSSHGIIRDVANATVGTLVLTGEIVFATRGAARHMYFIDEGSLQYCIEVEHIMFQQQSPNSPTGSRDYHVLERKERISEPALWMDWHHVGECTALCDSVVLALSGEQLFEAISKCQVSLWLAVKYAARFVSVLSHRACAEVVDDLIKLALPLSDLVDETPSNVHEHFAFISHYKEEAGTEATLVQAELLQLLQAEPSNPANDMACAVFLDSENLTDLQTLTEHVRRSQNLILLLTPNVLRRPWCLLEIATAFKHRVPIVLVRVERPGFTFEYPDDAFYVALQQILTQEAAHMLSREGVELSDLEAIIRRVFMHIAVPFSPHRTAAVRHVELADVLKRCRR